MSVTPNNIVAYGSVNMPEADGVIVGGAVDFTDRVAFYDITPSRRRRRVSSSASDTATKMQVTGRDTTGAIQTPAAITLNGTTPVTGSQTFERLLYGDHHRGGRRIGPAGQPGRHRRRSAMWRVYAPRRGRSPAHTAQAGSANTSGTTPPLFKLQAGDGASVSAGQIIRITGGTGQYQMRQIIATSGYGTDVVAVNRDWSTVPDNTTTTTSYEGMLFEIAPNAVTAITRCFATAAADVPTGLARVLFTRRCLRSTTTPRRL